jgi:adenylate kinase
MKPMIVLGLRGVGKSAVCAEIARSDESFEAVQVGSFIRAQTGTPGRQLSQDEYLAAMKSVVAYVRGVAPIKHVLLESGDFIIKSDGLFRCNYFHVWEAINPGAITILLAPPDMILQRRLADAEKRRTEEVDSISAISLQQNIAISCASSVASRIGVPLNIVLNQGDISSSAKILRDCVDYSVQEYEMVSLLKSEIL